MKRLIFFVLMYCLCFVPSFSYAQTSAISGKTASFGGKIISGSESRFSSGILCGSLYGPITIKPIGKSLPGPFFINKPKGDPRKGRYILGLHKIIPDMEACTFYGAPVPAFEIVNYGVSTR